MTETKTLITDIELLIELANGCPGAAEYAIYSILAFIRGPDGGDYTLKYLTTERVRSIVLPCLHKHCNTNPIPLNSNQIVQRDKLLKLYCNQHFASHYAAAVETIKRLYNYDLLTERSNLKP